VFFVREVMAFRYAGRIAKIYGKGLLPFHTFRCYESKSLYHKNCKITENGMMNMNSIAKKISPFISIVLLMLLANGAAAADDADVNVRVNAPEYVSDTFEVTIDITDVSDMDGGQFDLIFDHNVIDVIDVEDVKSKCGDIDDTEIPVDMCLAMDDGRIRLIFNLRGADGVSGSGYVAKILFEVTGNVGTTSAIGISDDFKRRLSDIGADEIPANWFGDTVTVGTAPSMPVETPTSTQAPTIVVASAPTPTATSIRTSAPNQDSPAFTARAQDAPAAAVPAAPSEKDGLQDILTTHNFISIYSIIGLLAFIYSLTLFR
jgi:hypothetical protein